eukprot:gnl/Carplike_NY0171/1647_a2222_966.p1 GENE.gnl/Carplike_NY0171/1647_a2222_966~~gnl/Carplike_NY0171/1647_a2222_966.p1  ORF type:complete len:208 (+),score=29.26 gnl/Carplike_NY0171/1647_a2222_966:331-954(+)
MKSQKKPGDIHFKMIIVGNASVGKTAILRQRIYKSFAQTASTIGMDFKVDTYQPTPRSPCYRANIYDSAGQEIYRSIVSSYFQHAKVAMLVYAIDDRGSYDNLGSWLGDLKKYCPEAPVVLCGNKCDLDDRVRAVSVDEASEFAARNGFAFFETSAKESININKAFEELYKRAIEASYQTDALDEIDTSLTLTEGKQLDGGEKKCCK